MAKINSDGRYNTTHVDFIKRVHAPSSPALTPNGSAPTPVQLVSAEQPQFLNQAPDQCYQDLLAGRSFYSQSCWQNDLSVLYLQNLAK